MSYEDEVFILNEESGHLECKHCSAPITNEAHKYDCSEYPSIYMGKEPIKVEQPEPKVLAKPICPTCQTEMRWVKYSGYYDSFQYWECKCEDGSHEVEDKWTGGYV